MGRCGRWLCGSGGVGGGGGGVGAVVWVGQCAVVWAVVVVGRWW